MRSNDLTSEEIELQIESRRKWPPERIMGVIGFIGGVVAVIFSLGVNYQNLKSVERRLDEHLTQDIITKTEFQRRDVSAESTRRLEDKIDGLSREFRAMAEQMRRIQGVPETGSRR